MDWRLSVCFQWKAEPAADTDIVTEAEADMVSADNAAGADADIVSAHTEADAGIVSEPWVAYFAFCVRVQKRESLVVQ
jgi:hypothetical protein